MNRWTEGHDLRIETRRLVSSHSLKRCTLCGAVNALTNEECFVCRWHGEFDTNPKELEVGVNQLLDRCPELAMAMMGKAANTNKRRTWLQKLAVKFASLLRWNVHI